MKRREFITLVGGAAACPLAAGAQQGTSSPARIGALWASRSENNDGFLQGLHEAGYTEGQNVLLEERYFGSMPERADEFVRELVALNCNIVFASNPYAIRAALKATSTIPIVGVDLESDPVANGWVKSVARPGGNLTGFFLDIPELGGKQIELLIEAVPTLSRLAILWDETVGSMQFRATETAPRPAGITLQSIPIRRTDDVDAGFERAVREQAHGVVLLTSPLIFRQRAQIAGLALNARLPTISLFTGFPKLGGMMAYGPDFPLIYRQAAKYVGRIVAGANPAELPIQRPTKFDLVINVKTAKAIGVTVPETLLVRADEVIE